ncbi:helix-turn-helix domain-containing protein [Polyangium fumosum]|uniref:XRE family transcriptional regulator n=1 Tax=Polyangium fumosum TaxID=889272 RepID=A0A4U1JAL9_9BACT|nr:helix-turn-helix transcriptional regulator [Polyangium fumosum]TKD06346.1 XRE family transcriptional regulator [Polyangium fumosum]
MSAKSNPEALSWLEQQLANNEFRLVFDQERASREFCEQLEAAMKRAGLARHELAARIGKSRSFVSQCLRLGRNLTLDTMSELAAACDYELHIWLRPRTADAGPVCLEPAPDWTSLVEAHVTHPDARDVTAWDRDRNVSQEAPEVGASPVSMWDVAAGCHLSWAS